MQHTQVLSESNAAFLSGTRVILGDFVRGVRIVNPAPPRRETEDDAFAHALYLERHGKPEEAERYLNEYLRFH